MRGLPSILSLFRNEFDELNSTGARILDYIYQHGHASLGTVRRLTPSHQIPTKEVIIEFLI